MAITLAIVWFAQITVALIFLQTLYFKFTGSVESVWIFSMLGIEPWGRYLTGILELCAVFLLFFPVTAWYGAALALCIIIPALLFHFTTLGLVVQNDKSLLFGLALTIAFLSSLVIFLRWNSSPFTLVPSIT